MRKPSYRALHAAQLAGDAGDFIDFMLDVILKTIKAKGVPNTTLAGIVAALGISRSAIQKHIGHLKDAQLLRRIGPDKGVLPWGLTPWKSEG